MAKKKGSCLLKTIKYIFYAWLIFQLFIVLLAIIIAIVDGDSGETVSSADGYTIEGYNVNLNVKEDNSVDVTETILVNFEYENYNHGIYKFTPEWSEYTGHDGKTIKRKSIVENLRALGDPYTNDRVNKKVRIRIGSADVYVEKGLKEYKLAYTYDMGKDPFKGFDEFIFHGFGDYWGTDIKNASINVTMPKSVDGYKVSFYGDKYRNNELTQFVDCTVEGNNISAKLNQEKYEEHFGTNLRKSLTIDVELPEGYFVGGSFNYGWISFAIIVLIAGLTIWTISRWIKYGKDFPKIPKTVEFYPPDKMDAAELGYIYTGKANNKLPAALIVSLASKGYLRIDELKDKDENILLTNAYPKPLDINLLIDKRCIKILQLKSADGKLSRKAKSMMNYLFKKSNIKELKTNFNKFFDVKNELLDGGYIRILSDNEEERLADYEKYKEEYDEKMKIYDQQIRSMQTLSNYEQTIYDKLFEKRDQVILAEQETLYRAFDSVNKSLKTTVKDEVFDHKATSVMIKSAVLSIIVSIVSIINYYAIADMTPTLNFMYYISFACVIVNIFFTIFMKRKTEYGEKITAQIQGFRDFLVDVEKEKLEYLVAENPRYFYDILPYTYVLNISKKWIDKFQDIPLPEANLGDFDYTSSSSLSNISDSISFPVSSSGGSSSGCSSCGGGSSSGGGGCSSCGGGGSW